jgi:aspartate/methionine/tyrosine aminotransferase
MSQKNPFEYAHGNPNVVWMSQNTNHLPTTPAIEEAVIESLKNKEYNRYPPFLTGLIDLQNVIKQDLGLPDYKVMLTSGGTEALYIAMRTFLEKGQEVITSDPSYFIIHHFIRLSGATPTDLPIYKEPYKYDIEEVKEAINDKTKMILFIDPLNPLGSNYTKDEVKAICDLAQDHDLILFDDITYRDFADEHHLTAEFAPERTLITYSVSKNCGLAGMRTGALLAPPELMEKAAPYNTNDLSINILGQRAALAALSTKKEWMPAVVAQARKNQAIIKEAVDEVDGAFLPVYPSMANMFVIDISATGLKTQPIQDKLLFEHDVFVRAGEYVSKKFGHNFIRASFTVEEEGARRFRQAFPKVMAELR